MDTTEKKIVREIEENKTELIDYLKTLISFPSENEGIPGTGQEKELQDFLYDDFISSGFDKVEKISSKASSERPNIVGIMKGKSRKSVNNPLMLSAHADVVPVRETEKAKWKSDPYKAVLREDKVYGRGASDCKGGLASIIFATKILRKLGIELTNDLFIVSSIGEESQEGETVGLSLVVDNGFRPEFAIIAEPSNSEIHVESPGVFFFELKINGKEAHTASRNKILFPQRFGLASGDEIGVDAIDKTIPFLLLMQKIEKENCHKWKAPTLSGGGYPIPFDEQGLGFFTITPTKMDAGQYIGAICGYTHTIFVVWYPNWLEEKKVAESIRKKVKNLANTDDWLIKNPPEFIYPTLQHWKPFKTSRNHMGVKALADILRELNNSQPIYSAFRAVCDCTFLQERKIPAIVFGPGGIDMNAHGSNEFVPVADLLKTTKAFALYIYRWCKGN